MSWQEYVDEHLMCELPSGGHLQSAAIVGLDGGIWAESESFPGISDPEVLHLHLQHCTAHWTGDPASVGSIPEDFSQARSQRISYTGPVLHGSFLLNFGSMSHAACTQHSLSA